MSAMRTVDAGNKIIMNIGDRDRSDLVMYPLMVAVVLFSYLAILIYYVFNLFSKYRGDVPYDHMFGVLALLLMGTSLILAMFYLLMVRNANHSKREATLRDGMIEYIEANGLMETVDVSQHLKKLKGLDERYKREEKLGNPKKNIIWIALPALSGFLLMWIPALREFSVYIIIFCYIMSIIIALVVAPHVTTFAAKHDKRTREFTEAFCNAYRVFGVKLTPTSKTVGYRSFPIFAILTIVTLGFFSIYWVYTIFSDMNKHFIEQWRFEDHLMRNVRAHEIDYVRTKRKVEYTLEEHWE